jgi:hypothetical protein
MTPSTVVIMGLSILAVALGAALAFEIGRKMNPVGTIPVSSTSAPFNLITFLTGYKTYITVAASVVYAVGIDYKWWPHSLTLDGLLGGGVLAAFRSGMKTQNAQLINAIVKPSSPAAQATADMVPEPPKTMIK